MKTGTNEVWFPMSLHLVLQLYFSYIALNYSMILPFFDIK